MVVRFGRAYPSDNVLEHTVHVGRKVPASHEGNLMRRRVGDPGWRNILVVNLGGVKNVALTLSKAHDTAPRNGRVDLQRISGPELS